MPLILAQICGQGYSISASGRIDAGGGPMISSLGSHVVGPKRFYDSAVILFPRLRTILNTIRVEI